MAEYKETYYNLAEDDMQALINLAKLGDQESQKVLLEIFKNFLSKWVNIVYYNRYKLTDYDTRQFIHLYIKDGRTSAALRWNRPLNANMNKQVQDAMRGVHSMVQRYGDEEDIRQTVDMTLFECIERYERRESKRGGYVPFSGYLYNMYYYLFKKNVDKFLISQLGRRTYHLLSDDEGYSDDGGDESTQGFHAPANVIESSAEDLLGSEEIDEFWVVGDTAMYPFNTLSIQERQLLKWRFVDGQKSSEIAKRITEHPNTVREHFNRIRDRIKEALLAEVEV